MRDQWSPDVVRTLTDSSSSRGGQEPVARARGGPTADLTAADLRKAAGRPHHSLGAPLSEFQPATTLCLWHLLSLMLCVVVCVPAQIARRAARYLAYQQGADIFYSWTQIDKEM
jgi:hypothetical protein